MTAPATRRLTASIAGALRTIPAGAVTAPRSYPDAVVTEVVDGDTLKVRADVGLDVHVDVVVRLLGCNAAEHGTPAGDAASAFTRAWVAVSDGWRVGLVTVKTKRGSDQREKYGRLLAAIVRPDGRDLVTDLIAVGHAVPWDGTGTRPT